MKAGVTMAKNSGGNSSASKGGGISIGLPKKTSVLIFFITAVLAVLLRLRQMFYNINFNTGRYISDELNLPVAVIVLGMLLISAVLLFGVAKDKVIDECILIHPWRLRYDRLDKKMPSAVGYSSILMSLLLVIEIVANFATKVAKNQEIKDSMEPQEARKYSLFTGIGAVDFIDTAFMILVLLIFITMAMNIFKQEGISRANCAAMSVFAAWKVFELFVMFSENNVIASSSIMSYDLLTDMSATIFFLAVARLFMGMEKKFTRFWVCFFGYFTSILAAVSVLPRYVLLLIPTGYDDRLGMQLPAITDIALIFIPAAIAAVFWTPYEYREMEKGIAENKRWTLMAREANPDMEDIDPSESDSNNI